MGAASLHFANVNESMRRSYNNPDSLAALGGAYGYGNPRVRMHAAPNAIADPAVGREKLQWLTGYVHRHVLRQAAHTNGGISWCEVLHASGAEGVGRAHVYVVCPRRVSLGALLERAWRQRSPRSHQKQMLMVASGLVLGEGVMSIVALALTAMGVPRLV